MGCFFLETFGCGQNKNLQSFLINSFARAVICLGKSIASIPWNDDGVDDYGDYNYDDLTRGCYQFTGMWNVSLETYQQ